MLRFLLRRFFCFPVCLSRRISWLLTPKSEPVSDIKKRVLGRAWASRTSAPTVAARRWRQFAALVVQATFRISQRAHLETLFPLYPGTIASFRVPDIGVSNPKILLEQA